MNIFAIRFISWFVVCNFVIHRKNNATLNSVKYIFVIATDSFLLTILIILLVVIILICFLNTDAIRFNFG